MAIPFSCWMSHVTWRGLCLPKPVVLEQLYHLKHVVYSSPLGRDVGRCRLDNHWWICHCLISEGPSSFPLVFNWSPEVGLRNIIIHVQETENSRPCTILKSTSWGGGGLQDALFGGMTLPGLNREGEKHPCCTQWPPHRNAVSILERDKSLDLAILFPGQSTNFGKLRRKEVSVGFPGGSVVKNLPANAGDTGSIPDPGRFHTPRSKEACVPQLLSPCSRAWEPQLMKPTHPRAHTLQQEKPPQ